MTDRAALRDFYRRYLECCNERRYERLAEFVHADVRINDAAGGFDQYLASLRSMIEPFPGYRWEPRQVLVDGDRLAARFADTGVTPSERVVETQEFAHYRVEDGKIVEVWGVWVTAGTSVLNQL